jgi:hypothetical protein
VRLGYPESTAKKIASGELPMDQASRMARAREQGHSISQGQRNYHGTSATGVPVTFEDLSIGGIPVFRRGQPVDYSPHQFTNKPQPRDYVRAKLQEDFLIDEEGLADAARAGGDDGLIAYARSRLDQDIANAADEWPEAVAPLERVRTRLDEGANKLNYRGGESPNGIEAFDPDAAQDGLYGRGVYMTDNPAIAGGGAGNNIAPQGYATAPDLQKVLDREKELQDELAEVRKTPLKNGFAGR